MSQKIKKNKTILKFMRNNYLLLFILFYSQIAFGFNPYFAKYHVYWHGIKAGVSEHSVKKISNNHYAVNISTEPILPIIPFEFFDKSEFKIENHKVKPIFHEFQYQESSKSSKGKLEFDWANKKIVDNQANPKFEIQMPQGAQDKVSHIFQLKEDLQKGLKKFKYSVAKKDEIKDYEFVILGEEKLNTKIGSLNTIKIEHVSKNNRRTIFWLAKELEYLMVKLEQIRKDKVVGVIQIRHFENR